MQFPCCSNPVLSKGAQTLSWGSASQAQEAQLRKPDRRSSEDLHSSLSPVPYLHTERAPGPAVHHSDHTESQRLPFLSLFSDSGTGGLLLLPSGQLWVWQPCPASGRLLSFQTDSGPTLNVSSFFYSVEWDASVVKERVASNVRSSGTGKTHSCGDGDQVGQGSSDHKKRATGRAGLF